MLNESKQAGAYEVISSPPCCAHPQFDRPPVRGVDVRFGGKVVRVPAPRSGDVVNGDTGEEIIDPIFIDEHLEIVHDRIGLQFQPIGPILNMIDESHGYALVAHFLPAAT